MEEEFYIGWQENSPKGFKKTGMIFFGFSLLLSIIFVGFYVPAQKDFSNSEFEYGTLTELEGALVSYPVYGLKTKINNQNVTVPLVGFGKSGVDALALNLIEKLNGKPELYRVKLRGTMIRYSNKNWMELTEGEASIVSIEKNSIEHKNQKIESKGLKTISGEIVDPKCFFGVMKPAVAKIHRSCAIRCIAGGVPPILAVRKNGKYIDYYFLLDQDGNSINQEILGYVGKQIDINGWVEEVDDWKALKVNMKNLGDKISLRLDRNLTYCSN